MRFEVKINSLTWLGWLAGQVHEDESWMLGGGLLLGGGGELRDMWGIAFGCFSHDCRAGAFKERELN
jgi:hypothetical protein